MTLPTTVSRNTFAGAGSTGPFLTTFPFKLATDLSVTKLDVLGIEHTLVLNVDYTVAGAGNSSGSVTLGAALALGESLTIRRVPPNVQNTSIRNQGQYFPSTLEDALDYVTSLVQALEDKLDRSFGVSESLDPSTLGLRFRPETGSLLGWLSPTQLGNVEVDTSGIVVPGGGRTVPTVSAYLANNVVYNVRDYGAKGDGATDDTNAILLALSDIPASGGTLYFPPGTYVISARILIIAQSNIHIRGDGMGISVLKVATGTVANGTPGTMGYMLEMYGCSNMTISDLELWGNRNNLAAGWSEFSGGILWDANAPAVPATNLVVQRCHVHEVAGDCITVSGAGVTAAFMDGVSITDCLLEDPNFGGIANNRHCIGVISGNRIRISGNQIKGTATGSSQQWGIKFEPDNAPAGLTISDAAITNNNISGISGIDIGGGGQLIQNIVIQGNTVVTHPTVAQSGIFVGQNCEQIIVASNTVRILEAGNLGTGIQIDIGSAYVTVSNNQITVLTTGSSGQGIFVGGAVDSITSTFLQIIGNVVIGCQQQGIRSKRPNTLIMGNLVVGCTSHGILLENVSDGAHDCIVIGNTLNSNGGYGLSILAGLQGITVIGNNFGSNASGSIQDLAADPSNQFLANRGHAPSQITLGAADSGGAGFRLVRVPN